MNSSFGKLVLLNPGGPEQEFLLNKAAVSVGRAMTNDIILSDGRVSRSHARLESGTGGISVFDLGSSNGTRINGTTIERGILHPGDTLQLGDSVLRYAAAAASEDLDETMIDTVADLDRTMDVTSLPVAINETRTPRLVVTSGDVTWEFSLNHSDQVFIGRGTENQIVIEAPNVSRRHAEIVRRGDDFFVRDAGSTNGTFLRDRRISEAALLDGDTIQVGDAYIIFKSGFSEEALTRAFEILAKSARRRPVVFIPGLMGSALWLGSERVWPNVRYLFTHPEIFLYSADSALQPRGIVDEVVIVPNLIKLDQYNRLGDYLVEDLGYERGKDFFEFAYDWRQDVRHSARQLAAFIDGLHVRGQITIVAHSLGTQVSRFYVERLGGDKKVEREVLMGGPHLGAVKTISSLLIAPELLPFGMMGERLRQVMMSFPSSYQILPTYATGADQHGNKIHFLYEESWLPEPHLPLLRDAQLFRHELGMRSSVPVVSIFGYGIKTPANLTLQRKADGRIRRVRYHSEATGDSTVLQSSAIVPGSEIHPVQQYHGSLFVDNDVKMRMKLELARKRSGK